MTSRAKRRPSCVLRTGKPRARARTRSRCVSVSPMRSPGQPAAWICPSREEVELRTHQPGIDVLIEPERQLRNWSRKTGEKPPSAGIPIPWGWFALIGLVIAGAVMWSLTRVEKAEKQAEQIRDETQSALVDEEQEEQEARELVDRIEAALRDFFAATTVEACARLVRQPERVTPADARSITRDNPVSADRLNPSRCSSRSPWTTGRTSGWRRSLLTSGKTQNLIIEIGKSGEPRIDWETLVCYQPMKWDDFVRAAARRHVDGFPGVCGAGQFLQPRICRFRTAGCVSASRRWTARRRCSVMPMRAVPKPRKLLETDQTERRRHGPA